MARERGRSWRDGLPWSVALVAAFVLVACGQGRSGPPPPRDVPSTLADVETVFVGFQEPAVAVGDAISELYGQGGAPVTATSAQDGAGRVRVEVRSEGDEATGAVSGARCLLYDVDPVRQEAHLQELREGGCPGI